MLYLLTMDSRWNQSSLARFRFSFFLLQIKYEATVTVCHSPVHICWRKTPWARNGKRWSFHPGPRWTLAGEQERTRGRKTQRKRQNQWRSLLGCKVILLLNRPRACICTPQGPEPIWSPQQCSPSPRHMLSISYAFTLEWSIVTN